MSAGTLAVTNNSATVTGTGTTFTTDLRPGDFIGVIIGGTPYTLVALTIDSDTSLTIGTAHTGPTASEVAWYAVPASLQVAITQKVLNDVATMTRGMILDKANWQQFYTGDGDITINLPDASPVTGPSWPAMQKSISDGIKGMAASGSNSDITELKGLTTALSIEQGGTGAKSAKDARTALGLKGAAVLDVGTISGTVAAGNDSRLGTVDGKSGGTVTSSIAVTNGGIRVTGSAGAPGNTASIGWTGGTGAMDIVDNRGSGDGGILLRVVNADNSANVAVYTLQSSGIGLAPGGWQTGSDERIKEDIQDVDPEFALNAVSKLRNVTFKMRDRPDGEGGWILGERSAGYLAQDLEKYLPEAVTTADNKAEFDEEGNQTSFPYKCKGDNGEIIEIEDMKSIDPGKAAAVLNGAAIKALYSRIREQDTFISELQNRISALDGLNS